jgi:hypothetical protein
MKNWEKIVLGSIGLIGSRVGLALWRGSLNWNAETNFQLDGSRVFYILLITFLLTKRLKAFVISTRKIGKIIVTKVTTKSILFGATVSRIRTSGGK